MSTSSFPWNVVHKYPRYKIMDQEHPCFCNVKEVYNYKMDGNYNGILSNVNFYSIRDNRKLNIKPEIEPQTSTEPQKSEVSVLASEVIHPEISSNDPMQEQVTTFHVTELVKIVEKQGIVDTEIISQRKHRFTGDELLNLEEDESCDLWEDFLPSLDLSIMAGKGGVGKTMLYLELALHIVIGKELFLERKISARYKSVLIIATEDNERRLKNRIKKQIKKIDPDVKSLKDLIIVTTGMDLMNSIRSELSVKKFDLVVIDALGDVFEGDQNSSVDTRRFFNGYQNLIQEFETTFLFVTHEGKSAGRDRRTNILGSVSIVDRVRSAFTLYNDDKTNLKALSILKSNNISAEKIGKPLYVDLDNETLTFTIIKNPRPVTDAKKVGKKDISFGADSRAQSKHEKPGRKTDKGKWMQCREMLLAGKKQIDIATELEVSPGTISRWAKKINQPLIYNVPTGLSDSMLN